MFPATSPASTHRVRRSTSAPDGYVYCPKKLAHDCANLPHLIGVYLLIGRLYLLGDRLPIPLSAHDLAAYDPSLSYGAAVRALDRLVCWGWLIEHAECGQKSSYIPTWGLGKGHGHPWQLGTKVLGRPAGVYAVCIDQHLLDTCIGKLDPHRRQRAIISRFVARPLLTLEDVGIYAQARTNHTVFSARLQALGLLAPDGEARDLPAERELLALASQHSLLDVHAGLTAQGWQRLGVSLEDPTAATSSPLFFVPPDLIGGSITPLIGNLIGNLITDAEVSEPTFSASKRPETGMEATAVLHSPMLPTQPKQPTFITTSRKPVRIRDADESEQHEYVKPGNPPSMHNAPPTPTAVRLNEKSVNPKSVRELATLPLEAVDHVIAYVETQVSDEKNMGGTIVNLLRGYRDTGELPTLSYQGRTRLEWQQQRQELGKDVEGGNAVGERAGDLIAEHLHYQATAALPVVVVESGSEAQAEQAANAPVSTLETPPDEPTNECADLTTVIHQHLQTCLPRSVALSIAMLLVRAEATVVVLECASKTHKLQVERSMLGPVRQLLLEQNDRRDVRIVVRPAAPLPAQARETPENNRPPWICAERWEVLPRMLRATLIGSRLGQGEVYAASPYLQQTLETRHRTEVAELIALSGL